MSVSLDTILSRTQEMESFIPPARFTQPGFGPVRLCLSIYLGKLKCQNVRCHKVKVGFLVLESSVTNKGETCHSEHWFRDFPFRRDLKTGCFDTLGTRNICVWRKLNVSCMYEVTHVCTVLAAPLPTVQPGTVSACL